MTAKIKNHPKAQGHRSSQKPRNVSDHAFKKVYWPYIPVVLIIAGLLSLGTQAGAFTNIARHPDGKVLAYASSMSIGGLLSDTNTARAQNGVSGLSLNDKFDAAAQAKANDMASRNYWSHNTPEGNPPWVFVTAQGYSYQKLGENLAAGFSGEQATINGWMASPPHRENLLDPSFNEVGFGYANNPDYTSAGGGPMTIVVAFYGKPQVLAAQTPPPSSSTTPAAPSSSQPSTPTTPTAPQPTQQQAAPPAAATPAENPKTPPATTETPINSKNLAATSSRAQIVFGGSTWSRFGTAMAVLGGLTAIGIWLSRHAFAVQRALARGETFVIRHPLMDVGLLIIAALSFLLSRTAGLIQ